MRRTDCTPGSCSPARAASSHWLLFVPVVNPTHEGRNELHPGLRAGQRLAKGEQQRQVGADAAALELRCGLDALPGGGDLDQHPVAGHAFGLVERHQALGALDGGGGVEA